MRNDEILLLARQLSDLRCRLEDMKREHKAVHDQLVQALVSAGLKGTYWNDGALRYRCSISRRSFIEYDEALLKSRLGDDYGRILAIDNRKVTEHEPEVRRLLGEYLEVVGTPCRSKVKKLCMSDRKLLAAFSGAFKKTATYQITFKKSEAKVIEENKPATVSVDERRARTLERVKREIERLDEELGRIQEVRVGDVDKMSSEELEALLEDLELFEEERAPLIQQAKDLESNGCTLDVIPIKTPTDQLAEYLEGLEDEKFFRRDRAEYLGVWDYASAFRRDGEDGEDGV